MMIVVLEESENTFELISLTELLKWNVRAMSWATLRSFLHPRLDSSHPLE